MIRFIFVLLFLICCSPWLVKSQGKLLWSDEFNVDGAIDTSKWFHQTIIPNGKRWFTGSHHHYTDRLDNSYVQDGVLHIVAKKEEYTDQNVTKQYTSARLNSKFAFTYGRIVTRAKMPTGSDIWASLFTLGTNLIERGAYWNDSLGTVKWPKCGEINVFEHYSFEPTTIRGSVHTPNQSGGSSITSRQLLPDARNEFHIYEANWTANRINFLLDGELYFTYSPSPKDSLNWPLNFNHYLLAIIGIFDGADASFQEAHLELDYVRVYEPDSLLSIVESTTFNQELQVFPNPVNDYLTFSLPRKHLFAESASIYTIGGRLISFTNEIEHSNKLTISWLKKGTYLLEIKTNKGIFRQKFLKL